MQLQTLGGPGPMLPTLEHGNLVSPWRLLPAWGPDRGGAVLKVTGDPQPGSQSSSRVGWAPGSSVTPLHLGASQLFQLQMGGLRASRG